MVLVGWWSRVRSIFGFGFGVRTSGTVLLCGIIISIKDILFVNELSLFKVGLIVSGVGLIVSGIGPILTAFGLLEIATFIIVGFHRFRSRIDRGREIMVSLTELMVSLGELVVSLAELALFNWVRMFDYVLHFIINELLRKYI